MFAAVHGVVGELAIIDAVGFPEDGNDQLNAIDAGLGNTGMGDERCLEPAPLELRLTRPGRENSVNAASHTDPLFLGARIEHVNFRA
jgi:hypothetical protein